MYHSHPYQKHMALIEGFIYKNGKDLERTAKSLVQALEKASTPFIMITPCQLMCLSRVGSLNKFRLAALTYYLDQHFSVSIARIPADRSLYIVARTRGMKLQTDDDLMIEPEHRNLCARDSELMEGKENA